MTNADTPEVPPTQRTPVTSDFPTGPAIGERFPDFMLPNQHGTRISLEAARAGRPAIVVFERSARW